MGERERLGKATSKTFKTGALTATTFTLNGTPVTAVTAGPTKLASVALAAVDTAGGIFSWVNPEVGAIVVTGLFLDVTTVATAACSVFCGSTAVSGTTSSANLIDTLDVHTATGTFGNDANGGTLGKLHQKVAAGAWVTGSKASGASAGLVGTAYIEYFLC